MIRKIAFIGHRNLWGSCERIKEKLYKLVEQEIQNGCKIFTMGTHGKFDKLALSVCRELRKTYKDIEIKVAITSLKTIEPIIDYDLIFGNKKYFLYDDVTTIMYNIEEVHYKKKLS